MPRTTDEPLRTISATVTEAVRDRLLREARAGDRTLSWVVRNALIEHVERTANEEPRP